MGFCRDVIENVNEERAVFNLVSFVRSPTRLVSLVFDERCTRFIGDQKRCWREMSLLVEVVKTPRDVVKVDVVLYPSLAWPGLSVRYEFV